MAVGDPWQKGVSRVRNPLTTWSCYSWHGCWKKNPLWFSVAVTRERTDQQVVVQDFLEDISHLDCSRLDRSSFVSPDYDTLVKSSTWHRSNFRRMWFSIWSICFLVCSVHLCSLLLHMGTFCNCNRGWLNPSAFPPRSKAVLTTHNFLCHLKCTRSKSKSSHTVTGISC